MVAGSGTCATARKSRHSAGDRHDHDVDPLSDLIALLEPDAVFSKPVCAKGDWGVRYEATGAPSFCIVLEGCCDFSLEGGPSLTLDAGDLLFMTSMPALEMRNRPGVVPVPRSPAVDQQRYGSEDGDPDFRMLAGTFHVGSNHRSALTELFPEVVHIPAANGDNGRIALLVQLIAEESLGGRPGRHDAMKRLMGVALIMIARWLAASSELPSSGLLRGLRDPHVATALGAMHADVRHRWTVAELATEVGVSRSAFAARFAQRVGCGPMEYLSRWRMMLARDALVREKMSLEALADLIGYQSASAFSTAFRSKVGWSPADHRKRFSTRTT